MSKLRRRTKPVEVEDCPGLIESGIAVVTIGGLSWTKVEKCQVEAFAATREVYGEHYAELEKTIERNRERKAAEAKAGADTDKPDKPDEPESPVDRVRAKGYHPPTLVRFGLVALDDEELPMGDADRRVIVDEMDRDVVEWLAVKIAEFNRLVGPEAVEKNG